MRGARRAQQQESDDQRAERHHPDLAADDLRDEDQCLQHLLGCPIDPFRRGERRTLGSWINQAIGRLAHYDDVVEARRVLLGYGVKIEVDRTGSGKHQVAVANSHTGLLPLFDNTRWQSPAGTMGVWTQALRRLPGAGTTPSPLYFGGANSRATLLPMACIPTPDGEGQASFGDILQPARHY